MPDLSADRPLLLPEKIFSEEDVMLVAKAIGADYWIPSDRSAAARDILTALAAAGRLLPPSAEHREEWAWRVTRGDSEMGEIEPPQASREEAGSVIRWHRTHGLPPVTSSRLLRRDVFTGSWVEADGGTTDA